MADQVVVKMYLRVYLLCVFVVCSVGVFVVCNVVVVIVDMG